jgi:aspartate aminotransferase-like enzyme
MAKKLDLDVEFIPGDWRHGADHAAIESRLAADKSHAIKAVCVVHNETSTGVVTRIPLARKAIDNAKHPALLMVDTISSLASIDYRHDEWGVDVTVGGSQKGLMLPRGCRSTRISAKASPPTSPRSRSSEDGDAAGPMRTVLPLRRRRISTACERRSTCSRKRACQHACAPRSPRLEDARGARV